MVILSVSAAWFYGRRGSRVRLRRVEGGWELSVPTKRNDPPILVRDGQTLQFGLNRVGMGETASAKRRNLVVRVVDEEIPPPPAFGGSPPPTVPSIEVFSHARLDELSISEAIEAIEAVGGRVVVAPEYARLVVDR